MKFLLSVHFWKKLRSVKTGVAVSEHRGHVSNHMLNTLLRFT